MSNENSMCESLDDKRTKRVWLWITVIGVLITFFFAIAFSFFAPEIFLTEAARSLTEENLVDAEESVRESIIQVGGSIIIIGTLALAAWRLTLTDRQLKTMENSAQAAADNVRVAAESVQYQRERSSREEQRRWEDKLRDMYADWAAALFYASIANCDIGDAKKQNNTEELRRAREHFHSNHFKAETLKLRILMMEKRSSLLQALKEIDAQKYPDGLFNPELRERFWSYLQDDPHLYRDVVGKFLELMRHRLEKLSELLTDPDLKGFSLPKGDNYLEYVRDMFRDRHKEWPLS